MGAGSSCHFPLMPSLLGGPLQCPFLEGRGQGNGGTGRVSFAKPGLLAAWPHQFITGLGDSWEWPGHAEEGAGGAGAILSSQDLTSHVVGADGGGGNGRNVCPFSPPHSHAKRNGNAQKEFNSGALEAIFLSLRPFFAQMTELTKRNLAIFSLHLTPNMGKWASL